MSSIIKVNTFQDANGNALFSSDGSGNVTGNNLLKPAFEAYLSSNQLITAGADTKIQFNIEIFDTNSAYDNSTNYRFTVPSGQGGKYNIYCALDLDTTVYDLQVGVVYIFKNGSRYSDAKYRSHSTNLIDRITFGQNRILDLSAGDYIEIYANISTSASQPQISADTKNSFFGAYKLIGA